MTTSLLIVGHANTGKTSLIRTLIRDHEFGDVQNYSGTTRHVEKISLLLGDQPLLDLIDTPGFEDSISLWQNRQRHEHQHVSNEKWLELVQQDSSLIADFEQELKVIKQLSRCDIILYVIDLRQAPLGKYLDELSILACANKPIVPILNFSRNASNHEKEWKRCLAERQLHAYVRYDTVAFYLADERKLYQTLQSLLPEQYDQLQALTKQREQDAELRLANTKTALAELLINCATTQQLCQSTTPTANESNAFEDSIRELENRFVERCLNLYAFRKEDVALEALPIHQGQWQQDLFDADTLKSWGISTGSSAATGAVIGAGIDILSAGLTLGTATTLGALIGAGLQTGRSFKSTLFNKLRNRSVLALKPESLITIFWRSAKLISHLHHRGHASQEAYQGESASKIPRTDIAHLEVLFQKLSQRSEWQSISQLPDHALIRQLNQEIETAVESNQ